MSNLVIFARVVEMGASGVGNDTRQQTFQGEKTVRQILDHFGISVGNRKITLNGSEVSLDDVVRDENANIALVPRKVKDGA